jgi:hypothetical protein
MATLGITYLLDGMGQTIFGSAIYKIDVGMPKEPIFILASVFPGGILINKEDLSSPRLIAATLVDAAQRVLPEDSDGPRAARRRGRPPGRPVHRHSPEPHLGHRLVCRRHGGTGGRNDLGQQARRAVLAGTPWRCVHCRW